MVAVAAPIGLTIFLTDLLTGMGGQQVQQKPRVAPPPAKVASAASGQTGALNHVRTATVHAVEQRDGGQCAGGAAHR